MNIIAWLYWYAINDGSMWVNNNTFIYSDVLCMVFCKTWKFSSRALCWFCHIELIKYLWMMRNDSKLLVNTCELFRMFFIKIGKLKNFSYQSSVLKTTTTTCLTTFLTSHNRTKNMFCYCVHVLRVLVHKKFKTCFNANR